MKGDPATIYSVLLQCTRACCDYSSISFISSPSMAGVPALAGKLGPSTPVRPGCWAPIPCPGLGAGAPWAGLTSDAYAVKMSPLAGSCLAAGCGGWKFHGCCCAACPYSCEPCQAPGCLAGASEADAPAWLSAGLEPLFSHWPKPLLLLPSAGRECSAGCPTPFSGAKEVF